MEVTSIQDGIIIDHVPAGTALKVLQYLKIDPSKTRLALIMNTDSPRYGTKDIIKIENVEGIDLDVLLVVGLSMLVCTVLGGIIGVLLPFVARRIGTDPATLSSPLITSIMDLVGVFIYFAFAYAFLGDLLRQAG